MDKITYAPEPLQFSDGTRIINAELARHPDPEKIRWLTVPQVIRIHDRMILSFGGDLGVLNEGRIDSALDRARSSEVFGFNPYPTILHKAASIMRDILLYHPFTDGQKRTGLSAAFIFLGLNGYSLWSRDPPDEVHYAIEVAKGLHEVDEVTEWLADRVAPPSDLGESAIDQLVRRARPETRRCHVCRRYLRLRGFRVRCRHCAASYRVQIRFGAETATRSGLRRFEATLGLVRDHLPVPLTLQLGREGRRLLMRDVRGDGGWNSLLRKLQSKVDDQGHLELSPDEILRIRGYAEHHGLGGFQARLAPVLEAIRREAADRAA
jgi:death-on-curing protein